MGGAVALTLFTLVTVNAEEVRVAPGGAHPLCQAIPVIEVRAHVRGPRGRQVTVVLDRPRSADLRRRVRLSRRTGRGTAVFVPPSSLVGGRYVARSGHDRATFRLTEDVAVC